MNNKQKEIQIKPTGSYFEIDKEGYLINPTAKEKIQGKWKLLVDDVIEVYKQIYGDKLHSVYIRGSVAKGEAIESVSDIDTFTYVNLSKEEINHNWVSAKEQELTNKYPFVNGVELVAEPLSDIFKDIIILNQSVRVWGDEVKAPKLKISNKLAIHAPNFHKKIAWFEKFLTKDESDEEIKKGCVWLMKGLLRVGFEITIERSQRYTRDLYPCYETFSEYYPEKESQMKEVLHLALNPTADKEKMKEIISNFGVWLLGEIRKIEWKENI